VNSSPLNFRGSPSVRAQFLYCGRCGTFQRFHKWHGGPADLTRHALTRAGRDGRERCAAGSTIAAHGCPHPLPTNGRGIRRSARTDLFGFAWRWLNRRMCVGNDSVSAPRFLDQLLVGGGPFTLIAVALHLISYQQSRTIELSPRLPQITFVTPLACIVFAWFKTWLITSCSVGV
jgi:hypothetical protein